jgi:dTDP-4-dehydrorhamnose reductase
VKILLFGSRGQLGVSLTEALNNSYELYLSHRDDCDLSVSAGIESLIGCVKPDLIINAAAYTNVDAAEHNREEAFAINAKAPEVMAKKASTLNVPLLHFSTDYVFDGLQNDSYIERDPTNPQSYYAKTKCIGEEAIRLHLKNHLIIRTSWLYGHHSQNFVHKIIDQLFLNKPFDVVDDEWGSPTSTSFVAQSILKIIPHLKDGLFGTYHLSNTGYTSRSGFASFIEEKLIQLGKIEVLKIGRIHSISSKDYQVIAVRPSRAILDSTKIANAFMIEFRSWQDELSHFLCESFSKG